MHIERGKQRSIQMAFVLAALLLVGKAAQLQLFDTSYQDKAQKTILFQKTEYPSRGLIHDRNGKLLVVNEPIYDLEVIYSQINPAMDTALFCSLLNIERVDFTRRLEKDWADPRYRKTIPFLFLSRIEPERYTIFQEHLHRFPGFYPVVRNMRKYPHQSASHVLGYIGEVGQETINSSEGLYAPGDYIGTSGLEKAYESVLRGNKGISYVLKDNLGREVGRLAKGRMDSSALSGTNLRSTLDLDLQRYGESLMANKRGSIVAIEPSSGEILAMLSAPAYDPNDLSIHKNRGEAFRRLLADTIHRPFLDRSIMAKYPPGSIFKPILALIGLQEGVSYINRTIRCNGYYEYRGFRYGCHEHSTPYNVSIAVQHSCNSYFFQLCRDVVEKYGFGQPEKGLQVLIDHLYDFGLGQPLGIDNLHENAGFIPTPAFYDDLYDYVASGWKSTYIMSIGIGQGELELTTVQMANLAAILANRGYYFTPHLITTSQAHGPSISERFRTPNHVRIDSAYFPPIIEGMARVVTAGTAQHVYIPGISVCGKTGTSQNPHGEDHSVFFAFAPKENPQIAIAVYVENAGWGATIAAPIASLMIEKYLRDSIAPSRKWLENRMLQTDLLSSP